MTNILSQALKNKQQTYSFLKSTKDENQSIGSPTKVVVNQFVPTGTGGKSSKSTGGSGTQSAEITIEKAIENVPETPSYIDTTQQTEEVRLQSQALPPILQKKVDTSGRMFSGQETTSTEYTQKLEKEQQAREMSISEGFEPLIDLQNQITIREEAKNIPILPSLAKGIAESPIALAQTPMMIKSMIISPVKTTQGVVESFSTPEGAAENVGMIIGSAGIGKATTGLTTKIVTTGETGINNLSKIKIGTVIKNKNTKINLASKAEVFSEGKSQGFVSGAEGIGLSRSAETTTMQPHIFYGDKPITANDIVSGIKGKLIKEKIKYKKPVYDRIPEPSIEEQFKAQAKLDKPKIESMELGMASKRIVLRRLLRERRSERQALVDQARPPVLRRLDRIGELDIKKTPDTDWTAKSLEVKEQPKITVFKPEPIKDIGQPITSGKSQLIIRQETKQIQGQKLKLSAKSQLKQELKLSKKAELKQELGKSLELGKENKTRMRFVLARQSRQLELGKSKQSMILQRGKETEQLEDTRKKYHHAFAFDSDMAMAKAQEELTLKKSQSDYPRFTPTRTQTKRPTILMPRTKSKRMDIVMKPKKIRKSKRDTQYTASLGGILSGVKIKSPSKVQTGIGIRGVVK